VVRIDPPIPIHRQLDDLEAELLEVLQRVQHRVMLDCARDDAVAAALARPRCALQREVERLRAAAREHDLTRARTDRAADSLVRVVERRARPAAIRMRGRWVAELAAEVREHGLERLPPQGRGGRMVEIDRHPGIVWRAGGTFGQWRRKPHSPCSSCRAQHGRRVR
jgi:hypothetical protein